MANEQRPKDAAYWDDRFERSRGKPLAPPDAFVLEALGGLAPVGCALDLASGRGRHALELARRGWSTTAWDHSAVGLAQLVELARARDLEVATRVVDLDRERPVAADPPFDLVVLINYLDRGLWPELRGLLRPGGHLIYASFGVDWQGRKPGRDWRLERGELARGLPGFRTQLVRERGGRAGILARVVELAEGRSGPVDPV